LAKKAFSVFIDRQIKYIYIVTYCININGCLRKVMNVAVDDV